MSTVDLAGMINDLRTFQTRARAMRGLTAAGADAVAPLLGVLNDPMDSARWAAAKCLTDIGDRRAVGALVERLDHAEDQGWALEFLARLTGENNGSDPDAWRRWWLASAGAAAPENGDADLVEQAVAGLDVQLRCTEGLFRLAVPLAEGRHQTVLLSMKPHDAEGAAMVLVYSACAQARPDLYEWALRVNLSLQYGALAVRDIKGQPTFVLVNNLLRATCPPLELRKTILAVAEHADKVEKRIAGRDRR